MTGLDHFMNDQQKKFQDNEEREIYISEYAEERGILYEDAEEELIEKDIIEEDE